MEDLATKEEVAAYLKVRPKTLDVWASRGRGPKYIKIGAARRYDWADIRAWVQARKVAPSPASEQEARRILEELRAEGLADYDPEADRYRISDLGRRALAAEADNRG